ncbi:MAG: hypothetical protein ACU837_10025, partial [Gammaproteobacteria bacterium]
LYSNAEDPEESFYFVRIEDIEQNKKELTEWIYIGADDPDNEYGEDYEDDELILYGIPPWWNTTVVFAGWGYAPERLFIPTEGGHIGEVFQFEHDGGYIVRVAMNVSELFSKFVGEKISFKPIPTKHNGIISYSGFSAKYRILEPVSGTYQGSEIEFKAYEHLGDPGFEKFKYVLLYVQRREENEYVQSYRQYTPVYKAKNGRWAGERSDDYNHVGNEGTTIKPEIIEFVEPVITDLSPYDPEQIKRYFLEPYYKIEGRNATAVYGNYVSELFLQRVCDALTMAIGQRRPAAGLIHNTVELPSFRQSVRMGM